MKHALLLLLSLGACKELGTISLAIPDPAFCLEDPMDSASRRETDASLVLVFAEPTSCNACLLGSCFGLEEDVDVIGPKPREELSGEQLALDPGHWAVVVEALTLTGRVTGVVCGDVDIDVDGTADKRIAPSAFACTAAP